MRLAARTRMALPPLMNWPAPRAMGVARTFHGHHHNQFDYSADRARLGFSAFGVGFRGIVDIDGRSSNQ